MNQVFSDEHTSNPPILSQVLSSQTFTFPETENADESTRLMPQSELMPTPSVSPNNGDERSEVGSNFNSGRKNKCKGTANPKSEALIDLMLKKLGYIPFKRARIASLILPLSKFHVKHNCHWATLNRG